jgi:hypothetical protein
MVGSTPSSTANAPSVEVININIDKKSDNRARCYLHFDYTIEPNGFKASTQDKSNRLGVTVVLGTREGGYLLNHSSFNVVMKQAWKIRIDMDFDLNTAEIHSGQGCKSIVLRIIHEFVGGLDLEVIISL